ncbi:MAG: (d)CMP kinase [Dethiobacter sp.]|jgi:cytidylate kinase|nr:(d)CMP kinase [Dethiobacter sp.]
MKPRIAIDGPAGAGKSTVARSVATRLGLIYLDTGAMYRAITLAALRRNFDLHNDKALEALTQSVKLDIKNENSNGHNVIYIDGENVSDAIRSPEVSRNVSYVACSPLVRGIMGKLQREFAVRGGVVMDGRDIGTHVMPDAEYKFFLTASLQERSRRRLAELVDRGEKIELLQMMDEISARDKIDSEREHAPLRAAPDAIHIDTTEMTIEQVITSIISRVGE